MVTDASKRGYDICVVNYRGLAGAKLVTPKVYTPMSYQDIEEPIKYVISKYGTDSDGSRSQIFAVGISMGANLLGFTLANNSYENFLDASVCLQAPMKLGECLKNV